MLNSGTPFPSWWLKTGCSKPRWERRWVVWSWVIPINTKNPSVVHHGFVCDLAVCRVAFSVLSHVVWPCWGCFTACFHMWFGCSQADLLGVFTWSLVVLYWGCNLGFYCSCTKTVQVVMLENNWDKVRSQTQPGTAPCSALIKILEHCNAPASSTTTKVLLKSNVFCLRCRGLDLNPSLHFRGGIQMASSHVSCSTLVWVECAVNNILHKELLNLFRTSNLQPIFLQAVSVSCILKWQNSLKSLFLTHTKHAGKL